MPVAIINRKIERIAVLMITKYIFCGEAISFNFTVDLYTCIYISHIYQDGDNWYSSIPIQWQKSTTLQRVPDTSMHIKIIHISVQGKLIGNIQNYEALEGVYWIT
jgi:hypothetical protein